MTFRATKLEQDDQLQLLTVKTPKALQLIQRYCYGTTWQGREARHVDVLWMGKNLALIKVRYESGSVDRRVVAVSDPKDNSSTYRELLRALSNGDHWALHQKNMRGFTVSTDEAYWRGTTSFKLSMDGRVSPRVEAGWNERLLVADHFFEALSKQLADAKKALADEVAAKEQEQDLAERLFLNVVQDALNAAGIGHVREERQIIVTNTHGASIYADGTVQIPQGVSANQFAAIVRAIRDN